MKAQSRRDALKTAAAIIAAGIAPKGTAQSPAQAEPALRLPRTVQVAIVGLEGHYSEILDVVRSSSQVKLTAVAEKDPALSSRVSSNPLLKGAVLYRDYREMLDNQQLDVVAVCGANDTRAAIVQACAERKLAVVAEKPLAMSLEELAATRRKVTESATPITILLPMRFAPQYQAMRSIVRSGQIGEVVAMAAQKSYKLGERPSWMKRRASFGGISPYIGIHMVDLMRWASAREFVEAAAFQSNVGFPDYGEMENNAVVIYRLDNNGTATVRLDYLRPDTAPTHGDDRLRIAGTRGIVEYQEHSGVTLIARGQKPSVIRDLPPQKSLFADFLDAIYNGRTHEISRDDVFRVNEIVLKARDAAESRSIVKI